MGVRGVRRFIHAQGVDAVTLTRKHPMKRGKGLSRVPIPRKARTPIKAVNRKRKASEFARCYHSKERVEFVKALPCAVTGILGSEYSPVENAHVTDDGTKGAGQKSGYRCIAPMLKRLHRLLHDAPWRFAEIYPDFNAERAAADTEAAWQAYSHSRKNA